MILLRGLIISLRGFKLTAKIDDMLSLHSMAYAIAIDKNLGTFKDPE